MGRILLSEVIKPLSSSNAPIKNKASKTPLDGWYPAYSASGQDVWLPQFRYEGNGIVVSSVGARCGKAFKATGKWNIVANTQPLQLDETMIDFDYAWRLLNNEEWWVKSGTGQPFVKVKASLNRTVQLPCLEEQRLISNKLNKLDENVNRLASLQIVLDNLIKSRFIELFGDPVSNSKALPTQTLASVAPIEGDSMPKSGAVWLLNLDAIESGTGRILRNEMTEAQDAKSSIIAFSERHVLISKLRPYLNKVVIPHSAGICTSELLPLLPNKDYLTQVYLAYTLRSDSFVRFISQHVAGAKMPRIDLRAFKSFEIPIPEMSSQLGFEDFVTQVDKLRFNVQQQIEKLQTLKRSLMQEYFG